MNRTFSEQVYHQVKGVLLIFNQLETERNLK